MNLCPGLLWWAVTSPGWRVPRPELQTHLLRSQRPVHPRSIGSQGSRCQHAAGQHAQPEACGDSGNGRMSSTHPALSSLPPHTHGSHLDHKGQNDAQWEADDVVGNRIHHGSKGLPAGSSQDSAIDTLGGSRGRLAGMGRWGSRHLLGGLLNSHRWCSQPPLLNAQATVASLPPHFPHRSPSLARHLPTHEAPGMMLGSG